MEWKAFGVLFDLEGVLAMIPAERRGRHKLSLSVAGDPAWATAKQARQHVAEWGGVAGLKAGNVLIDNCRYGFVSARAVLMQRADGAASRVSGRMKNASGMFLPGSGPVSSIWKRWRTGLIGTIHRMIGSAVFSPAREILRQELAGSP